MMYALSKQTHACCCSPDNACLVVALGCEIFCGGLFEVLTCPATSAGFADSVPIIPSAAKFAPWRHAVSDLDPPLLIVATHTRARQHTPFTIPCVKSYAAVYLVPADEWGRAIRIVFLAVIQCFLPCLGSWIRAFTSLLNFPSEPADQFKWLIVVTKTVTVGDSKDCLLFVGQFSLYLQPKQALKE